MHLRVDLCHSTLSISINSPYNAPFSSSFNFNSWYQQIIRNLNGTYIDIYFFVIKYRCS
jgi:hypothetical protein